MYGTEYGFDEIKEKLIARVNENLEVVKKQLKGIKWITQDPQRQWTSSINPIIMDPREFYGIHYETFLIGLCGVDYELTLRMIRNRRNSPLSFLNKDMFKHVLEKLLDIQYD